MQDVIVVGGGLAGLAAAREVARAGRRALLLEARDRLGGRTWTADWSGVQVEYGGGWVHWHQPHTWSEVLRHGLEVVLGEPAAEASWYVGEERRTATSAERDVLVERGWNRFVDGVEELLPQPYDPLLRLDLLARVDGLSIAQRLDEIELSEEERAVLVPELEGLAHGRLDEAGAVSVLRWHALSGYSLALTQYAGGRVGLRAGTGALVRAVADELPFERRLGTPVVGVYGAPGGVEVHTAAGQVLAAAAAVVAVPLNALGAIAFDPPLSDVKREAAALGQASRGLKIFIRVRGEPTTRNAIRGGHPFGYLDSELLLDDQSQVLIGFGPDAESARPDDLGWVQAQLDAILPGYEAVAATAHDWLADPYARGTWAIHRPGWYARFHRELQRPEGRVLLAGSDLADGWAGFMDGALESGSRTGRRAVALLD